MVRGYPWSSITTRIPGTSRIARWSSSPSDLHENEEATRRRPTRGAGRVAGAFYMRCAWMSIKAASEDSGRG
jgi:hypothetical protein